MNTNSLKRARLAAERFVAEARELELLARKEKIIHDLYNCTPKLRGSVRRASMDLTRALADLRRPC